MDLRKWVQTKKCQLYTSIGTLNNTIQLKNAFRLDGAQLVMADDFGVLGFCTIEPGGLKEEIISFTGLSYNLAGTICTLSGVTRGLKGQDDYSTGGTAYGHNASRILIFTNNPQHYAGFANKYNEEEILNVWTFNSFADAAAPKVDNITYVPAVAEYIHRQYADDTYLQLSGANGPMTGDLDMGGNFIVNLATATSSDLNYAATIEYVNNIAIAGAPDASETVKGIVEEATQAEVDAGTGTGATGARLFVNPEKLSSAVRRIAGAVSGEAGENITANDLCFLANRLSKAYTTQYESDGNDPITVVTNWRAQTFTTDSNATIIKKIYLQTDRDFSTADLVTFTLRATVAGLPTGPALATTTVAVSAFPTNAGPLQLTFNYACTPSTVYALVMDFTAVTFGGTIDIRRQSTNAYPSGQRATSADGVTWAGTATDFAFVLIQGYDDGKIYKCKGVAAGQDTLAFVPNTSNIGYAQETVTAGTEVGITIEGIVDSFVGLTAGSQYWSQPTNGTIGTTELGYFAGIAISTTEIQISKGKSFGKAVGIATTDGYAMMPSDGVFMANLSLDTNNPHLVEITENGVHTDDFQGSGGSFGTDLIADEYKFQIWGGANSTGAQTGFITVVKSGQWLKFENIQQGGQQFAAFYPYI